MQIDLGDRAFSAVWNYLPTDLRQLDLSYSRFRQLLKAFLFGLWENRAVWIPHL